MLRIINCTSAANIFSFDYIDEDLSVTVICPGPSQADKIRGCLSQYQQNVQFDVLTINKFMRNDFVSNTSGPEYSILRKSEILLHFGTIYKMYQPQGTFEDLLNLYNIFSELRGVCVEWQLIEQILTGTSEEDKKILGVFWNYLSMQNILDEHGTYSVLGAIYKGLDENAYLLKNRRLVFLGFKHFSGTQIDMLKSLAIHNDVYIPIPDLVLQNASALDWPSWLELCHAVNNQEEVQKIEPNVIRFPKGGLRRALDQFLDSSGISGIIIANRSTGMSEFSELSRKEIFFKSPLDLFEDKVCELKDTIIENFSELERGGNIPSARVYEFIQIRANLEIAKSFENKDARMLKTISTLMKNMNNWRNLSASNDNISLYDLLLLTHTLSLDLPRNFLIPLTSKEKPIEVVAIQGIESYLPGRPQALLVSSKYSEIIGGQSRFPEELMQKLATLGPIHRPELEYYYWKFWINSFISQDVNVLFLEDEIEKESSFWDEILTNLGNKNFKKMGYQIKNKQCVDVLKSNSLSEKISMSLSATKLQAFMDCPRKFFFSYIENLQQNILPDSYLLPYELGNIEHEIVQKYLMRFSSFDVENFEEIFEMTLTAFRKKREIKEQRHSLSRQLLEVRDLAESGIIELLKLTRIAPSVKFKFEVPFSTSVEDAILKGSIDCVVEIGDRRLILDFKRSASSIPSKTSFLNYFKVQLWCYARHLGIAADQIDCVGYLNLDSPSDSLIFVTNEEMMSSLKNLDFVASSKIYTLPNELSMMLKEYSLIENELVKKIIYSKQFPARSVDQRTCQYCHVSALCQKENADMEDSDEES